ncbi:unnamed protein product [Urochloa decumbens]|uniref:DUF4220 domain-containing protein n=1 Tax=Urochloa decumbens TaxID=240449 RepID=A0ABC9EJI2_9POAL
MRPIINGCDEEGSRMEKQSVAAVQELWNVWEIHCLMLVSLSLQVFLFLISGMRRRSASRVLSTALWLAYLSADSVAIFVLGHLAVRASQPGHQLMSFWAPFVLVHLGGQDTITAFSKQDNELWMRHLLSLVTQVAVAGYVVGKASWPDGRLRAAMVIMFLSGCFKYAERTLCLYGARPDSLRAHALDVLSHTLERLQQAQGKKVKHNIRFPPERKNDDTSKLQGPTARSGSAILAVDAPLNELDIILIAEDLPGMLMEFLSNADRYGAYKYVGALLVDCYKDLYTKNAIRESLVELSTTILPNIRNDLFVIVCFTRCLYIGLLLYTILLYVLTPIALVLFMAAEKGHQIYTSRADIMVSYILLVGAIVLDVPTVFMLICSNLGFNPLIPKYIQPACCRKQWSEELAQYSMIKRHVVQDPAGLLASIQQWICRRLLGDWGLGFIEVTSTPITQDHTPIKEFVLDDLLGHGTRKEWDIARSRGRVALQAWMDKHGVPVSERPGKALVQSSSSDVDFPTSVLIWHLATDMCYYSSDNASTGSDHVKKRKQMSRELSNYITYLVFKCSVMLTTSSQLVHEKVHGEIRELLLPEPWWRHRQVVTLGEKDAVMRLFKPKKKEELDLTDDEGLANRYKYNEEQLESTDEEVTDLQRHDSTVIEIQKLEELSADEQDSTVIEIEKLAELADNNAAGSHIQKLLQSTEEALYSPVLFRAREVAKELISINDETERWDLIASVWLEMLYYTVPRCGGDFHYEHLATGGEFATHVLLLMRNLGPFLPTSGAR